MELVLDYKVVELISLPTTLTIANHVHRYVLLVHKSMAFALLVRIILS
jgi:hypothetical protein